MNSKKKGFTLIELLVVVAIIGLLSTLSIVALNNARARARDARRVADIKQIQTALELYYNDNSSYPSTITFGGSIGTGTSVYMAQVPSAPLPADCASDNTYTYTGSASTYALTYCVGSATGGISGNVKHTATPAGIQ